MPSFFLRLFVFQISSIAIICRKKEANTEFIHYNKMTFKQLCKMYDYDVYLFVSLIAYTVRPSVVTTKSCKYNPQILLFA